MQNNPTVSRYSKKRKTSPTNKNSGKKGGTTYPSKQKGSKGDEESLGYHVFGYGTANDQNQYNKTLETIISFIGRNHKQSGNIITLIRSGVKLMTQAPATPNYKDDQDKDADVARANKATNRALDLDYVEKVKSRNKQLETLDENVEAAYSLVWGQCTPSMQAQLKTMNNYEAIRDAFDVFELLKEIKGHTFRLTDRDCPYQSVWDSYVNVFNTTQARNEFLDRFQERFNCVIEAAEGYGCRFGCEEVLWETDEAWSLLTVDEKKDKDEIKAVKSRCREGLLAYGFTSCLGERFGIYKKSLKADYAQGNNRYKLTVVESYQMALDVMRIYQKHPKENNRDRNKQDDDAKEEEGATFVQDEKETKGCFKCGAKDYKKFPCDNLKKVREKEQKKKDKKNDKEEQHLHVGTERSVHFNDQVKVLYDDEDDDEGFAFAQTGKQVKISKAAQEFCDKYQEKDLGNALLLDSRSTIDLIKSRSMLEDLRHSSSVCNISTNGGQIQTDMQGVLPGYGKVWHHPEAITNILSLHNVKSKFRVTYDSNKADSFYVHKKDGIREFKATGKGLYALVTPTKEYQFLETMEENKKQFTKKALHRAAKAKELYGMVQYPSMADFKSMVRYHMLKNCPVTIEDVEAMEKVYGPSVAALKGKTVRKKSPKVKQPDYVSPPPEVLKIRDKTMLEADVIYVSQLTFWFTLSRKLEFLTVERITNRSTETVLKAMFNVLGLYQTRGLVVRQLCVDAEFGSKPFVSALLRRSITVNSASAREHVSGIERKTRTLKERVRARRSQIPYKRIPKVMTSDLVRDVVSWLNQFPNKSSLIPTIGAGPLITGVQYDYQTHCRVEFGQYCEVHEDSDRKKQC